MPRFKWQFKLGDGNSLPHGTTTRSPLPNQAAFVLVAHNIPWVWSKRPLYWTDQSGEEWLLLDGSSIFVKEGYAWGGITPQFLFGAKDTFGERVCKWPSLVHDVLYQMLEKHASNHPELPCPWTRYHADLLFYHLMRVRGFPLALPYYWCARVFGSTFWWVQTTFGTRGQVTQTTAHTYKRTLR